MGIASRVAFGSAAVATALALAPPSRAAGLDEPEIVLLSPAIGEEIDLAERTRYGLFPEFEDFRSARIVRRDGQFVAEIVRDLGTRVRRVERVLSQEDLDLTRRHIELVDECARERAGDSDPMFEARALRRMALRYALDARYDLAAPVLEELESDYPEQSRALGGPELLADVQRLRDGRTPLFRARAALDRRGRNDVLVFAGYYGIWLAAAIPASADADSPEPYGLSFLTIPAASLAIAHVATRDRHVTDGDAVLVSLGGHLGTYQGIGWASVADGSSRDALKAGVLAGVTGIALGTTGAVKTDISEGHAALLESALVWGAWLGWAGATAAGVEADDDRLSAALLGSDALIAGTALGGRDTSLTKKRVRLMNLGGAVGAFFGAGVLLLADDMSDAGRAAVLGGGSLLGAAAAIQLTGHADAAP